MSKGRIALALAALLWAGPALAQGMTEGQITTTRGKAPRGEPVGGILDSDSTFKVQRMNSDGSASTSEVSKDRDWITFAPNAIQNIAPNCPGLGTNDSSGAIDTRGWAELAIRIHARPDRDSVWAAQLGISWYGSSVPAADTTTAARFVSYITPAAGVVADSVAYRHVIVGSNADTVYRSQAQPGEVVLTAPLQADGNHWYFIPLYTREGAPFRADYTFIKVRVLRLLSNGAAVSQLYSRLPTWSGSTAVSPIQCFRVDLVGRR